MYSFRHASIRNKLTFLTLVTTGLTLALACSAFVIYDYITIREQAGQEIHRLAKAVGVSLRSPLLSEDRQRAREVIEVFGSMPRIEAVGVYLPDGQPVVVVARDRNLQERRKSPNRDPRHQSPGALHLAAAWSLCQ